MNDLQLTSELNLNLPGPRHLAIEGDNLTVLPQLHAELAGRVDLILIDPPYNTGGSARRRYVDGIRDWPEFMHARLTAARPLLSPLGVILIAIDDQEHHRLRTVLDDVFGARNFLTTLIWQGGITPSGRFTGGGVDYMVAYALDKQALIDADVRWTEAKPGAEEVLEAGAQAWAGADGDAPAATEQLRRWWKNREHQYGPGMHEYSRIDSQGRVFRIGYLGNGAGRTGTQHTILHPTTGKPVQTPSGGWVASAATMNRWIAEDRILFSDDPDQAPWRKLYLADLTGQAPEPTFHQRRDQGTKRLLELLGSHQFTTPKDPDVLARWIRMIAPNDATVLDFFAGSGTTAEAVIRLNAQDGGTRRAVLVTNNEVDAATAKRLRSDGVEPSSDRWEAHGVFRAVTEPRIRSLITGIRPDGVRHGDPIPARFAFCRHVPAA